MRHSCLQADFCAVFLGEYPTCQDAGRWKSQSMASWTVNPFERRCHSEARLSNPTARLYRGKLATLLSLGCTPRVLSRQIGNHRLRWPGPVLPSSKPTLGGWSRLRTFSRYVSTKILNLISFPLQTCAALQGTSHPAGSIQRTTYVDSRRLFSPHRGRRTGASLRSTDLGRGRYVQGIVLHSLSGLNSNAWAR